MVLLFLARIATAILFQLIKPMPIKGLEYLSDPSVVANKGNLSFKLDQEFNSHCLRLRFFETCSVSPLFAELSYFKGFTKVITVWLIFQIICALAPNFTALQEVQAQQSKMG